MRRPLAVMQNNKNKKQEKNKEKTPKTAGNTDFSRCYSCKALLQLFIYLFVSYIFFARNRTSWNSSSIINAGPCRVSIPASAIIIFFLPPPLLFREEQFLSWEARRAQHEPRGSWGQTGKERHNLCLSVWLWCKTCIAAKMKKRERIKKKNHLLCIRAL